MAMLTCTGAVYVSLRSVYAILQLVYVSVRLDHGLRVAMSLCW